MNDTTGPTDDKVKCLLTEAKGALDTGATINILRAGGKKLAQVGIRHTQDIQVARRMAQNGANLGMQPGQRLLVVDVDIKGGKQGDESWRHLERRGLPDTRKIRTPSGGLHAYFTLPHTVTRVKTLHPDYPSIDFLSGENNVVLAGSTVDGVTYKVIDKRRVAKAPEWLVELIDASSGKDFGPTSPGDNDVAALKRLLARIPNAYLPYQTWTDVGFAVHHETDGSEEGRQLFHEWSQQSPKYDVERGRTDKLWDSSNSDRPGAITIGTLRRMAEEHAVGEFEALDPEAVVPERQVDVGEVRGTVIDGDFLAEVPQGRDWLLKDLIIRGYVGGLTGRGGSAKSTGALLAALSMATGRDLLGFGSVKQGRVMFVSNEESNDEFKLRLRAAMQRWDISLEDLGDRLHFKSGYAQAVTIAEGTFDSTTRTTRIKPTMKWMDLDAALVQGKFDALIIDPLANMLLNVEENDNVAMSRVMEILRKSAHKNGLGILLVHHSNKAGTAADPDGSARGASAIVNSLRCLITMTQCNAKMLSDIPVEQGKEHLYIQVTGGKSNLGDKRGISYLKLSIQPVMAQINGVMALEHVATLEPVASSMMEPTTFRPEQAIIEFVIGLGVEAISRRELVRLLREDDKFPTFKRDNTIWEHIRDAISDDETSPTGVHGFNLWIGKGTQREEWGRNAVGIFVQKVTN